jgi:hypothetical protein
MSSETPIACSLDAAELDARRAEIAAVGTEALRSVDADGTLRFRSDTETRRRLEAIVAAEAQCCSFLDMRLRPEGDELALTIVAPSGAEAAAQDLVDAFAGGAGQPSRRSAS